MAGAETSRALAFSLRRLVVQPLNNAPAGVSLGIPLVVDTPQEVEIKADISLDEVRGGAYLLPLAADPKEAKFELTAKLLDCPPLLAALTTPFAYVKNSVAGPAIDAVSNIIGSSVSVRLTVTIAGTPGSGIYAVVAADASHYNVFDLSTGKQLNAAAVAIPGTDTASITGVQIVSSAGSFVAGDVANIEVVNIGASGSPGGDAQMETLSGPTAWPVILPQAQIYVDATRRGQIYSFWLYTAVMSGISMPIGQGKYAIPDFKAEAILPASGPLYRWRRIA